MIKIYHNSRCRKSREGVDYLKSLHLDFEIVDYLKNPFTEKELSNLIHKLAIKPIELVRKNEPVWKENYKNKIVSDKQIIEILVANPKLIERPIVENQSKAVVARPANLIEKIV